MRITGPNGPAASAAAAGPCPTATRPVTVPPEAARRPRAPAPPAAAAGAPRTTSGSFSLPQDDAAPARSGATAVRTVGGIEALMALQGVESAEERRRRAVKRGHTALDLLDEMKIALLSGRLGSEMLH